MAQGRDLGLAKDTWGPGSRLGSLSAECRQGQAGHGYLPGAANGAGGV